MVVKKQITARISGYFFAYFLEIDMALRTSLVAQPHLYMGDTTGRPLDAGKVYFGQPNKDPELYPINVFYDEALTIAAPQPIRTMGGFMNANGQMVEIYAAETTYSVKVLDGYGRQVFYQESMSSDNAQLAAQKLDTGITATAINENAIDRALSSKVRDTVSVKDFGAIGVYPSDDTTAIEFADSYCHENGKTLIFPDGQYGISRSITKKASWKGTTSPRLMPFPQKDDDKIYLAPNKKKDMVGSSLFILPNFIANTITTQRSDMFSTLTYAVKTHERYPSPISDLAIIMDMNVFDASGNLTTPTNDERVEVDVGYLMDDSSANTNHNLTVWGYFDKAGLAIWSRGVGDNPDYNKFFGGSTMGYHGLAILANDTAAGNGPGLSGSQFYGFQLFANDHHSRAPQSLQSYQTNAYGHLIFIDGETAAVNADANGHEFIGGGWRTYSNRPVKLNNCSNIHLVNVPFEFSQITEQPDTTGCKFLATSETRNVHIMNSRNFDYAMVDHAEFGDVVEKMMVTGDFYGDFTVGNKGAYVRMMPTGGGLDPRIQFTRDLASSESGWTFRMDVDNADKLQLKNGSSSVWEVTGTSVHHTGRVSGRMNMRSVTATLTANAITIPDYASYVVIANGGATGTLSTITGAFEVGDVIYLTAQTNGTIITLKHTGGNIRLSGKADVLLQGSQDKIQLIYDGTNFIGGSLWDAG